MALVPRGAFRGGKGAMAIPLVGIVLGLGISGCGGGNSAGRGVRMVEEGDDVWVRGDTTETATAYRVGPNDVLQVTLVFLPKIQNVPVNIRPDGRGSFPSLGEIEVSGLTVAEVETLLADRYGYYFREPKVMVDVTTFAPDVVYVVGEITRPGAYRIRRGMTVLQAIADAGGTTESAQLGSVALLRRESPSIARATRMNLKRFLAGKEGISDPDVAAYDIVYVPRAFLAKADLALRQIFQGPGLGVDLYLRGWEAFHTDRVYATTRPEERPTTQGTE